MSDESVTTVAGVDPKSECLYLMVGDHGLRLTAAGQERWSQIWGKSIGAYLAKYPRAWDDGDFRGFIRSVCVGIAEQAKSALGTLYPNPLPVTGPVLDYAAVTVMIERFRECKHLIERMAVAARKASRGEEARAAGSKSSEKDVHLFMAVCADYLTDQSTTLPEV